MAYRFDPTDNSIVIDGWEQGVADNPFSGIANLSCVDVDSTPGEAAVNFATDDVSPGAASTTFTADAGTDLITVASTTNLLTRTSVTFTTTGTLPTGLAVDTPYWLELSSGSDYKVYTSPNFTGTQVNITGAGSGTHTLTAITLLTGTLGQAAIQYFDPVTRSYGVDTNGLAWGRNLQSNIDNGQAPWVYLGNNTPAQTNAEGNGIIVYRDHIFVFRRGDIDYISFSGAPLGNPATTDISTSGWVHGWNPATGGSGASNVLNTGAGFAAAHQALVGQDDIVYYTDRSFIGSFNEKAGQTFDPTNTATFTWTKQALDLPEFEATNAITELGTDLLIGSFNSNNIYPWDRISSSFNIPIKISEENVHSMVTVNANTYIFAGTKGNIYITNGTQATLFKKIPSYLTTFVNPRITWLASTYHRNNLYFSFLATNNSNDTGVAATRGVWALSLVNGILTLSQKVTGNVAVYGISPNGGFDDGTIRAKPFDGVGLAMSYFGGIDESISDPYTGSEATIETDIIPVGTFKNPKQFREIEYKLSRPIVSGESITIKARFDLADTYTTVFTENTAGEFEGISDVNFDSKKWVQFQIVMNSTATTPSQVRLREIRIR